MATMHGGCPYITAICVSFFKASRCVKSFPGRLLHCVQDDKVVLVHCARHAHEQVNAGVKGEGGAVCLTENPAALRRWMVAGPR